VLIAAVGIGWAFAFNALSFVAVLAALLMMRTAELQRLPHASRARGQLREGLHYVRANPILLWPIVLVFFVGTFGYNFAIILSAYTQNVFQSGADLYGLLNTAMAAGSVTGALVAARRTSANLPVLFAAAAGFGLSLVVLGLTPWFWAFLVLLVVVGFVSVTFNTLGNATVQLSSSPELRGRVMSLYMLVFMGGTPIGSPIVGAITQQWGAPTALVVSGVICLLAAVGAAMLAVRSAGSSLRVRLPAMARQLAAHGRA
jgi:predicted MFS family arabinose efflux permease